MTKYEKIKLAILTIFVLGFLFCFYNYTQNGRYVKTNGNWHMDTRSGDIYNPKGVKYDAKYRE